MKMEGVQCTAGCGSNGPSACTNSIEQLCGLATQCRTGKINERQLTLNDVLCSWLSEQTEIDCRHLSYETPCWLVLVL
jgi:hypothetical protein